MDGGWVEVGDQVYVRHHESWSLNTGLVVGGQSCVVIDTRTSVREGRELAAAVRKVTDLPWAVVNTHAHVDHALGNAAYRPAEFWGHRLGARMLVRPLADQWAALGVTMPAKDAFDVELVVPDRTVDEEAVLDLGDRRVLLNHLGRGHTDNDVVVKVLDTDVVFAGDLIRENGIPWLLDSFPLDWPATLTRLETLASGPVVPGHGKVVDGTFIDEQQGLLSAVAAAARKAFAADMSIENAAAGMPLKQPHAGHALTRAYRQLAEPPDIAAGASTGNHERPQ